MRLVLDDLISYLAGHGHGLSFSIFPDISAASTSSSGTAVRGLGEERVKAGPTAKESDDPEEGHGAGRAEWER